MNNLSQKRLVDTLIEAYVSWREACLGVSDAYRSWASETGPSVASAFGCCMAALEQEERAAEVYAGLVRRAGPARLEQARRCRTAWRGGLGVGSR